MKNQSKIHTLVLRLSLAIVLNAGVPAVFAQANNQIIQATELRGDRFMDASVLQRLSSGESLKVLRYSGAWAEVEVRGQRGWVLSDALKNRSASASSGLLGVSAGRAGRDMVITTGIRGYKRPASGQIHALIMGAGQYQAPGISQLKGIPQDMKSAAEIADRLGVPPANMTILQDGDLTLEGFRKSFEDLHARVKPGDDVFIYFSGHGGRQSIGDEGASRCAESFITIDGKAFLDQELQSNLERLSQTATKIIVFADACHSGGAATRSVAAKGELVPKNATLPASGAAACSIPVNVVTRSIQSKSATPGSGGKNFVYIAAAREDEVAFDSAKTGGVATQAWLTCLRGEAEDSDRSGGLTARELVECAQKRVNKSLARFDGIRPHHITITGNGEMPLSYKISAPEPIAVASAAATSNSAPAAPASVSPNTSPSNQASSPPNQPTPPSATPTGIASSTDSKPVPAATFQNIFEGRDDKRLVELLASKTTLKINQDRLDFRITSREAGFLYLLMAGSDGKTYDILFPNKLDPDNRIKAGETVELPRSNWRLLAGGPEGKNTVLAIVSNTPRDFSSLRGQSVGPFSVLEVNAIASKDIQLVSLSSPKAESQGCGEVAKRNLVIAQECSNSYGAAKIEILEVK
jgi:hypothetical protein